MKEGDMVSSSGHSYFGVVSSVQEAHAILEASKQGLLPRVTRRLTDEERLRFVRAGAVFVWEEEEAGIRRWTDHVKWSPSRVSGAFLTYTEVPSRGEDTLIKQSFSSVDSQGTTKMHLIAYTSKAAFAAGKLPSASRDPLLQDLIAQRIHRDPRPSKRESPMDGHPHHSSLNSPPYGSSGHRDPEVLKSYPSSSTSPYLHSHSPYPPRSPGSSRLNTPNVYSRNNDRHWSGHQDRPHSTSSGMDVDRTHHSSQSGEYLRPRSSSSAAAGRGRTGATTRHHDTNAMITAISNPATRAPSPSLTTTSSSSMGSSRPPSAASSSTSSSLKPWPFAYNVALNSNESGQGSERRASSYPPRTTTSSSSSSSSSFAPNSSSTFSASGRPPPQPRPTTATQSDPFVRHLPPLYSVAKGKVSSRDSPPRLSPLRGTFIDQNEEHDDHKEESMSGDRDSSANGMRMGRGIAIGIGDRTPPYRAAEDERQLRLLSRGI